LKINFFRAWDSFGYREDFVQATGNTWEQPFLPVGRFIKFDYIEFFTLISSWSSPIFKLSISVHLRVFGEQKSARL